MQRCDIGVVGLGVMGKNLARNFAGRGYSVAGYDRDVAAAQKVAAEHPEAKLVIAESPAAFIASLTPPRRIVMMVNAGKPVDSVLESLAPHLGKDDVVVDGGNSLFSDTQARLARVAGAPWHFVGMGVSGGSEGALHGPALMPGGTRSAYDTLAPLLTAIAARSELGPCVTYCGAGGAGHFVKMVHNGIEYGDMQLISEVALLLRDAMKRPASEVASTFEAWSQGELESFLIEITAKILRVSDPDHQGALLVDDIRDAAGQKGTGKWTVIAAAELGVAIPTIAAAVDARQQSAKKEQRVLAEATLRPRRDTLAVNDHELANALYLAKVASYAQGFLLLSEANRAFSFGTNPAEVARVWTAGCIIRAALLKRITAALAEIKDDVPLVLAPAFIEGVQAKLPALRKVVGEASRAGWPVPGLAASLGWLETLMLGRGGAALIQAQRDYFGGHTFERLSAPGIAVHFPWEQHAR